MKKIKIFTLLIFIITSCSKEIQNLDRNPNERLLSKEEAIKIIQKNGEVIPLEGLQKSGDVEFQLIDDFTFFDKNGLPAVYVFNYIQFGDTLFSLTYADENVIPLIAFGKNYFDYNNLVPGVQDWLNDEIRVLEYVREKNYTLEQYLDDIIQARVEPIDNNDNPCEGQNWVNIKSPLMTTAWGQGCSYNSSLASTCTGNWWTCDRVLTGCVATAMAQVINYHEQPANNYNWSLMLNTYAGGVGTSQQIQEVGDLMLDVGNAVDMDWGCNASSPNNYNNSTVEDAFEDVFNYDNSITNQAYTSACFLPVKNNINAGRPVIFDADDLVDWVGHMWVSDGYLERNICHVDDDFGFVHSATFLHLHMNWGWNGSQNGFYGAFNLGGLYPDNKRVILNIKP